MTKTLLIAHRGDTIEAPESTLPAFAGAIAKGADAIEFDVHVTRDGELIIHHDTYLGRTETASGYISDYTFDELRSLDVGSWFNKRFEGTRMPSLREVLDLRNETVRFEIELRTPSLICLQKVAAEVVALDLAERVELTSPHVPLLWQAKKESPNLRTGLFFEEFPEWMQPAQRDECIINWLLLSSARVAHLPISLIDGNLVRRANDREMLIHGADLNSEKEIQTGLEMNIDQFSTDKLDLALNMRKGKIE